MLTSQGFNFEKNFRSRFRKVLNIGAGEGEPPNPRLASASSSG